MHLSAALIARSRLHVAPALREADLYEALSYLQKALAEEPLSASVRTTLGVVYLSQGRQEEALRIWQQVAQQEGEASFAAANLRALQHQAAASPGDVATCDVRAQHAAPTTTKRERIQQIVVGSYTGALPQVWGTPYERTFLFEGGFPQTEQGTMALVVSDYPNGLRTLSQDQSVVMIQVQTAYKGHSLQDVTIGDTATHVRERYGEPVRILPVWHGESWSYDTLGIAFRLHDGIVVSWVLY
jgi:tetratricopeptide (TPR) repeat protein